MSVCTLELAPAVAGASLLQSGSLLGVTQGTSRTTQYCPGSPANRPDPLARQAIDDKIICAVMCCCADNPNTGGDGQNLQQGCAHEVLRSADELLGFKSRYKSEVSYDMHLDEGGAPTPLMHRDKAGNTTERSRAWQYRAKSEIEGYAGGAGMVRRPDIVIVDDPCLAPAAGNIERVVELKFGRDTRDKQQDKAYEKIAGDPNNYQVFRTGGTAADDERTCDCKDKGLRETVRAYALKPEEMTEQQRQRQQAWVNAAKAGAAAGGAAALAAAARAAVPYLARMLLLLAF